jgi:hypothetical protein
MTKCVRCDKTSIVNHIAKSEWANIKTGTHDKKKDINTCIECISPKSRVTVSDKFKRYEYAFLNSIYHFLDEKMPRITKETNTVNKDKTRYDLLLSDGKTEKEAKFVILVEIDEKQHFNKPGFIDGQMREDIFKNKYGKAKKFILRIRVSEDGKLDNGEVCSSCININSSKLVTISNKNRYNKNMKTVTDHITSVFSLKKPKILHAYINFSDDIGIRDFTKIDIKISGIMKKDMDKVKKAKPTK